MAGPFPLDGAFASLRREVEGVQAALIAFRGSLNSGGGVGGSGAAGSTAAQATAANTAAIRDVVKFRDLLQSVSDVKAGFEGGRDLAKLFGLKEAAERLDHVAKGLDIVDKGVKGITGAVKLLGAAWRPVVVGVSVTAAGLVGLQRAFEATTGTSFTLKETVQVMGLTMAKAFADANVQVTRLRLAFASPEATAGLVAGLEDARASSSALQETIREIQAEASARGEPPPFRSWTEELVRAKDQIKQLVSDVDDAVGGAFGGLGTTGERTSLTGGGAASSGFAMGVEYTSGLTSGVSQGAAAINEELLQALTVDPDDGEVITSFKDLWKNIGKVFASNPIGFLGGLFGSSGVGGGGGVGFATGGMIGRGGSASLAHLFAGGFAGGGRPGGLDPRDTVPIWAQPGEWVIQARAAAKYGTSAMAALNAGLIDSGALAALAGGFSVPAPARHSSSGYALGGAVAPGGGGTTAGPQVLPVMVTDRAGAEQIAHAGRGAILRLFSEDPDFRGLLNR